MTAEFKDMFNLSKTRRLLVCLIYLMLKPGSQHGGLCITCELENHVNAGPISIWDVKEELSSEDDKCIGPGPWQ